MERSVLVDVGKTDVEVKLSFLGTARMYSHALNEKLGDFLGDVKRDFKEEHADLQDVKLTDGAFALSNSTQLAKVWGHKDGALRKLVFVLKDKQEVLDIQYEVHREEPPSPFSKLPGSLRRGKSDAGEMRYILVTGGVLSGIGKGMTASSIGVLMRSLGFRVTAIKIDPYLNVDAGTMSPFEHGEVFVLDDGGETDLDLGNYERFLKVTLTRDNNITTGKVFQYVLERERRGDYLGKTVQVVPHLTDTIIDWIDRVSHVPVDGSGTAAHVCIIELGGTVGDIESAPYIEALRQFQFRVAKRCIARIHVSLVPTIGDSDEEKTKPTQHSVRDLRALGLHPDVIVCRSRKELTDASRKKIGQFCHVPPTGVISAHDITNLYHLPLLLHAQGLHTTLLELLDLHPTQECDLSEFGYFAAQLDANYPEVKIALIGKYTNLKDSYISVIHSLTHAAMACDRKIKVLYVESHHLEMDANSEENKKAWETIRAVDGMVVPGGFGDRGIEGKILALEHARTNGIPVLGVCLGMQLMVIEFCRNVLGWKTATSEEFDTNSATKGQAVHAVVYMPEIVRGQMGGTMRLGSRSTLVKSRDTITSRIYGHVSKIDERHRHRYEVNPKLVPQMEEKGFVFAGHDETKQRMEIVELPESVHRFYYGTQYHPEFKSRPGLPSAPFFGLILASSKLALP
eukprot:c8863_g1_i1.p1 GENE.c8863_g1_i1~~c8863_g1_i1.p1  ORF type:complete len:700 (+),score=221.76 c8863_g1_i1:53-2101(+)